VLPLIEASGFNVRILVTILALIGLMVLVGGVRERRERHGRAVDGAPPRARRPRCAWRHARRSDPTVDGRERNGLDSRLHGRSAPRRVGYRGAALARRNAFGFSEMQMNGRVFAASLVIACATPVGFGLLPALRLGAPDPQELRDGTRAAGATLRGRRMRHLIVGLQACAAMILMVQIGLFVRFTWKLRGGAVGIRTSAGAVVHISLPHRAMTRRRPSIASSRPTMRLRSLPAWHRWA
jgi:hypothetical protein